jgi:hypothetical protein
MCFGLWAIVRARLAAKSAGASRLICICLDIFFPLQRYVFCKKDRAHRAHRKTRATADTVVRINVQLRRFSKACFASPASSSAGNSGPPQKVDVDVSPHTVQMIPVEPDVKLEVLDWGGTGRPLVLLAAMGDTAHVFDKFAPKLSLKYHVYGLPDAGSVYPASLSL